MAIDKRVLTKAFEMGAVRGGKMMGALKQKIIGREGITREQGLKDFKKVRDTFIKPTAAPKTVQQFGRALDILKEAKVLRSGVSGPLTLLQRAKLNVARAQFAEDLAKKQKMQERTKKSRLEEEGVTGIGGRGLLEKIEKEENTTKTAEKVLNEVKSARDTGHSVSISEVVSRSKEKAPAEPVIPPPPMDF